MFCFSFRGNIAPNIPNRGFAPGPHGFQSSKSLDSAPLENSWIRPYGLHCRHSSRPLRRGLGSAPYIFPAGTAAVMPNCSAHRDEWYSVAHAANPFGITGKQRRGRRQFVCVPNLITGSSDTMPSRRCQAVILLR